jgi:anti-sigma B factor antagonist
VTEVERKNFDVQVRETADTHTVYLRGELDLAVAVQFRSVLEPLIPSPKALVLNVKDLTYIDSTGMGIIIFILKARTGGGREFFMAEIPAKIKRLLDLTGITKFLPVKDSGNLAKADGV